MKDYADISKEELITEIQRLQVKYDFKSGLYENYMNKTMLSKAGKINPDKETLFQDLESDRLARAQESLRETSEYLENLFRYGNAPVIVWDTAFNIIRFNPAFESMTGRKANEVIGQSIEILFPPELVESSMEHIMRAHKGERMEIVEIIILHKDGSEKTVQWNSAPMFSSDGKVIVATIAQGHDVTERKRANEELRKANNSLELLSKELTDEIIKNKKFFETTGRLAKVGGWEMDLEKNEMIWSDMVYQIFETTPGYKPTMEGSLNFYTPEAIPVISKALENVVLHGQPYDLELQIITFRKNIIWVRSIGEAFYENGKVVKIIGMYKNINPRKLAEIESLQKSEQLKQLSGELETIIDNIPGLVFYKDINNRYIRVNRYMCEFYGKSKKQLEGTSMNDLHSNEQAQIYYEDDLQVIKSRRPKMNIVELWETKTGIRWVNTSKMPYLNQSGDVVGVIGVSMDVTERKKADTELENYRRHLEELVADRTSELAIAVSNLEHSNKELEQFAYVASHDLQEPLRMVSSYTQLIERRYKDKLDQDANDFIRYAVDGANRMQKLINDLLDFSRISSQGKVFSRIDMSVVLGYAVSNLHHLISENLALVSNENLPVLNVDESQLIRVFQNLIENSIKYKKKTEMPRIHISCVKKNKLYEFSVRDNGIGIEKKYHDRIFIIFQRLHTKEEYPGTGIGLSISKRIVERHGGTIWFESNENEGTTFYFTIPGE